MYLDILYEIYEKLSASVPSKIRSYYEIKCYLGSISSFVSVTPTGNSEVNRYQLYYVSSEVLIQCTHIRSKQSVNVFT